MDRVVRRARALMAGIAALCVILTGVGPAGAQSPSASPGPGGQAGVVTLGADQELLRDDFSELSSWGLVDRDTLQITGEDGGLRIRQQGTQGSANWTWRDPFDPVPVLRVGVDTVFERGPGEAGPACGTVGDSPSFFIGIITSEGDWVVARIVGNELTVVARGPLPGPAPVDSTRSRIEIECAVTGDGGDRVALFVDGLNVGDVTDATSIGPFGRPGLYAGIYSDRFEVLFDDLVALGGDTYAPVVAIGPGPDASVAPSEAPATPLPVGSLLDAVPEAFRGECRTVEPDTASDQHEAILCVPAAGMEAAEYYRYGSTDGLEAAFTRLVPAGADVSGTDCAVGGSMVDYTVDGRSAGVLACYDGPRGGITFQWSNRDLLVLAFGTTRAGSYADAYAWWQGAGPQP